MRSASQPSSPIAGSSPPRSEDPIRARSDERLPDDIAFLRAFGVPDDVLFGAVRGAGRAGTSASAALTMEGGVTDTLFFFSLARHLGIPFVWRRPTFADGIDAVVALRTGRARLADGSWLLAPDEAARRILLATRGQDIRWAVPLALTTPARFAALIREALPKELAAAASSALPEVAPHLSARGFAGVAPALLLFATCCAVLLAAGMRGLADGVGVLFLAAVGFKLLVSAAGLRRERVADGDLGDGVAPTYSVLVPLYREAEMVPSLLANLRALDYPRTKLEILFLTEEDDRATRAALLAARLPAHMRVVTVPDGQPRTKPRALNVGLMLARGEFVTVYDAEDRPDPAQLKQAVLRFRRGPPDLACLQARLAIATRGAGLLAKLFAVEYAALFDLFNVGAARCGLPIAIGGTSNHFRAAVLRRVGGWDAYNVTEDADLGLRLARFGYGVGDLASTTLESAEENLLRWFNQRRRWTKGWMQTALVLLRDGQAARDFGFVRWCAVLLLLTNLVIGPLLTPFALAAVAAKVALFGMPEPRGTLKIAETTLAVTVLVLGAFQPIWCGLAGMRRRGLRGYAVLAALLPYQLMICFAAWGGLVDLVRRPYHWRKTVHTAPLSRSSP